MPPPGSADSVCQLQPVEFDQEKFPKPCEMACCDRKLLLCFGLVRGLQGASYGCGDLGIGSVDGDIQPYPTLFVVLSKDQSEIAFAGTDT